MNERKIGDYIIHDVLYNVRKSQDDIKSQIGVYANPQNAIKACPPGYGVYVSGFIYKNLK